MAYSIRNGSSLNGDGGRCEGNKEFEELHWEDNSRLIPGKCTNASMPLANEWMSSGLKERNGGKEPYIPATRFRVGSFPLDESGTAAAQ